MNNRLIQKLKMQIDFLKRSCYSFDSGFQDEAFRIAVVLRVLFHSTKQSTSLLKHLDYENLPLISTKAHTSKELLNSASLYMGLIQMRANGLVPKLNTGPIIREIDFIEWWNEVVLIPGKNIKFTRRRLVLEMANKDGGAHIDKKISAEYEIILNGVGELYRSDSEGNISIEKVENMHLITVRQIAFEVINSRSINKLIIR